MVNSELSIVNDIGVTQFRIYCNELHEFYKFFAYFSGNSRNSLPILTVQFFNCVSPMIMKNLA